MFSSNSSLLPIGALCAIVGAASGVLAQNAPEPVKAKVGAPDLGQAKLRFTPDPANLALAPCPDPVPQRSLNQYVISSSMPTSIALLRGNSDLATGVLNDYSWNLSRSGIALLPPNETSARPNSAGDWIINPYHLIETDQGSYRAFGFLFDVYTDPTHPFSASTTDNTGWNFPANNNAFGEKTLTHTVQGNSYPAQVALFYPSSGFQHPSGGPSGYFHSGDGGSHDASSITPTANFVYYYEQAWNPPVTVEYWLDYLNNSTEAYYADGDDHVHIAHWAYGAHKTARFAQNTASSLPVWVGWEETYGIDTFARLITHENKHKYVWEWPSLP